MLLWCRVPLAKWAASMPPWDGTQVTPLPANLFRSRTEMAIIRHMDTPLRDKLPVDAVQRNTRKQRPGVLARTTLGCGGAPRANSQQLVSSEYKQVSFPNFEVRTNQGVVSHKFSVIETHCTCTPPDDRLVGLKRGGRPSKQALGAYISSSAWQILRTAFLVPGYRGGQS